MNRKTLLLAIVALLLMVIGNRLAEEGVKRVKKHSAPAPVTQQDYYLNGVTITVLNKQGQPQHRMQASHLSHYRDSEVTEIQQAQLQVFEQGTVNWQVTADHGEIHQQRDEILLQGDVTMSQSSNNQPLRLTTQALRIQPDQGRADTDKPVTLLQDNNRIEAVGMQIEQQGQRLLLLSQVRAEHATLAP